MTTAYDVLVVGELNADLILRGDTAPAWGQAEKLVDDATLTLGSSSAIFACGAARLGLRVVFVGVVGADEFGRFVLRELAARGVDTSAVITNARLKTGLSVILSRPDDRAILTYSGASAALRYDQIDQALLGRARHLHLGSYFLLDALRPDVPRLFAAARARGLSTSLDTNYDPAEQWQGVDDVLRHTDIFLPNETELAGIRGQRAGVGGQALTVAVKRGERGAMAVRGDERAEFGALPVAVVDTTGAGDSFDAGFVYGHLAGWDLQRTLRLAAACGALSTRAAGGTAAQPTLAEALAFVETVNHTGHEDNEQTQRGEKRG